MGEHRAFQQGAGGIHDGGVAPVGKPVLGLDVPDIQSWKAQLIRGLLRAVVVIAAVVLIVGLEGVKYAWLLPIYVAAYAGLVAITLWQSAPYRLQAAVLLGLAYGVGVLLLFEDALSGSGRAFLLTFPVLATLFFGKRQGFIALALATLALAVFGGLFAGGYLAVPEGRYVYSASLRAWVNNTLMFFMLSLMLVVSQDYLVPRLANALVRLQHLMRQLESQQAALEDRSERLQQANELLCEQAVYLELALQVGQTAALDLDQDEFIRQAIRLICDSLQSLCVDLFLVHHIGAGERPHAGDAGSSPERGVWGEGSYAVLEASVAQAGQAALARPFRLPVDLDSPIGRCAIQGKPQVIQDVRRVRDVLEDAQVESVHWHAFWLAEAATAVVVPLSARGQVIGALVVQSAKALYDEDVSLLHSVADQVALAISNAQLAAELRARLQQMEALQRIYTREAWEQFLPTRTQTSYEYVQSGFSSPGDLDWPEPDRMPDQLRVVALDTVPSQVGEATTLPVLIAPLGLRDQTFGFLGLYHEQAREWTEEEMDIVAAVAEQVALIMDNARLYEEAQLSAGQERKVREVTAHMRQSLNVESVIRAAVEDMYQALQLDQVIIRLAAAGKERE